MTVPSAQSIVLIDIQLMADSRRHKYQHKYFTEKKKKNQDGIMGLCANFKTNSVLQIPLQALRFYEQPCF